MYISLLWDNRCTASFEGIYIHIYTYIYIYIIIQHTCMYVCMYVQWNNTCHHLVEQQQKCLISIVSWTFFTVMHHHWRGVVRPKNCFCLWPMLKMFGGDFFFLNEIIQEFSSVVVILYIFLVLWGWYVSSVGDALCISMKLG